MLEPLYGVVICFATRGRIIISEYLSKRMISDRCGMEGQTNFLTVSCRAGLCRTVLGTVCLEFKISCLNEDQVGLSSFVLFSFFWLFAMPNGQ